MKFTVQHTSSTLSLKYLSGKVYLVLKIFLGSITFVFIGDTVSDPVPDVDYVN